MPRYIIERQYLLPGYEQLLIDAPTCEAACREALDESAQPWSEDAKQDFESVRPVTLTQAVELPEEMAAEFEIGDEADRAGLGHLLYTSGLDPLPIPAELTEEADDGETVGFP